MSISPFCCVGAVGGGGARKSRPVQLGHSTGMTMMMMMIMSRLRAAFISVQFKSTVEQDALKPANSGRYFVNVQMSTSLLCTFNRKL